MTILIADTDEELVRTATEALREQGFECESATQPQAFAQRLEALSPGVLVASTELIRHGLPAASRCDECETVILVDSLEDQIPAGSLRHSVCASLVKPVATEDLLHAVTRAAVYQSALNSFGRVRKMSGHPDSIANEMAAEINSGGIHIGPGEFLALSVRNIASALGNITALAQALSEQESVPVCRMFRCPRVELLKRAVKESIEVLQRTKKSFKSKELGRLREHLETILDLVDEDMPKSTFDTGVKQ